MPGLSALTEKQRKLIKGVAAGKSQTQAAILAGYSEKTAAASATETLGKPNVREALQRALEKVGVSDELLAMKTREGLDATRGMVTKDGVEKVEDFHARHRYLETALKLKGALDSERDTVAVQVNVDTDRLSKLYQAIDENS